MNHIIITTKESFLLLVKDEACEGKGAGGINEESLTYGHALFQCRAGVTLIAKFCINIAFFRCHMHFSHIAVSPYAK